MKQLTKSAVATLLLASTISAEAVILSLAPTTQTVKVGDKLSLDILFDTEGKTTVGGAFSVNFDNNAFDFSSFNFDSSLPDDPFFRVFPSASFKGKAFNLGFGNFAGIEGTGKVGSIEFQTKKTGNFDFILDNPLLGHDPFSEGASYVNAKTQVDDLTVTPEPTTPEPTPVAPTTPEPTTPEPTPVAPTTPEPTPVAPTTPEPTTPEPTPVAPTTPEPTPVVPTTPEPVPLPAAVWLFLSGITSLGLISRRKRSTD